MLQDLLDRIFRNPETGIRREAVGLRELAQLLDVCYKTLLRAAHAGRLEAVHVGRQWKIGRDALEQYIDAPNSRRLPKFRLRDPIDDFGGSFPESMGTYEDGEPLPF